MRVYREVLMMVLLLSYLPVIPTITSVPSKLAVPSSGRIGLDWLRTEGKFIVDSEGNVIFLRGANFMGYEFGVWDSHTEEDYAKMASWGFNVVRLPIAWHYIEPQPGIYNLSYLEEYVDRDILWAKKYGIYLIIDMHQYKWSPHFTYWSQTGKGGNGMPSWLVSGYPDTSDGRKQATTDFWLGKGPNGTAATETNPSMQDRFMAMWKRVASRYANESTIAAFDVFNEPHRGALTMEEHAEILYPFYEKLIFEIRESDSNHLIVYEPTAPHAIFGTQGAVLLNYSNIVFSFHFYRLRESYDGNRTLLENTFVDFFDPVKDWNIPILVGEFNTHADFPNATLWINDVVSLFNEHQLGWAWWTYYKSDARNASLCYSNGTERVELTQFLKFPAGA